MRVHSSLLKEAGLGLLYRMALSLCLLTTIVLLVRQNPVEAAGKKASSLRIVTYNTAFMKITLGPPLGDIEWNDGMAGMDYEERAQAIAERIIADDNDIVALNEVFSEDAKEVLVNLLSGYYPHYIREIRGTAPNPTAQVVSPLIPPGFAPAETNDSGLMLFSKYPFVKFSPSTSPIYGSDLEVEGRNGNADWGSAYEISAVIFKIAAGVDGLASKGAAMVRIRNPNDDQIINIVFTHLQASDKKPPEPESTSARRAQFLDVKRLIINSLTKNERKSQQVYFLGDLNVVGANKQTPTASDEWQKTFQSSANFVAGFFSCGNGPCAVSSGQPFMTDPWGFETSTRDRGISNNVEDERLDYVLHNKPIITDYFAKPKPKDVPMCMQHVAIAYELGQTTASGVLQLSDHFGLRADFNKQAAHCSPDGNAGVNGPKVITFTANSQERVVLPADGARITYPGSMQWYRLDKPGSYSVKLDGSNLNHVAYSVYAAADLSRPILPFYNEVHPRHGPKFIMTDPPYYVRVYAKDPNTGKPDREWKGSYMISFHEYRGISPDDSISLAGGYKQPQAWPGPGTPEYPAVWFDFHTNKASSNRFPDINFLLEVPTTTTDIALFDLKIRDDTINNPIIAAVSKTQYTNPNPPNFKGWDLQAPNLNGTGGQPKKYFLTVTRDQMMLQHVAMQTSLTFGTTLTYTFPETLLQRKSLGMFGDTVDLGFVPDGPMLLSVCTGPPCYGPIPMTKNSPWPLSGWPPFQNTFVGHTILNLWVNGGTYLNIYWTSGPTPQPLLGTLRQEESGKSDSPWKHTWADGPNAEECGYWYELTYRQSHDQMKH